jgi:dinuclear metal center YbgI/SA1388 family protein
VRGAELNEIIRIANELFPFSLAEPWDNSGLQLGDPNATITAAAFSLDPSPTSLRFAADHGCGLLVCHHPLFLAPVKTISTDTLSGRVAWEAARLGIAILALHTNLDAACGGLNDHVAELLGLQEITVPGEARCARIGLLPEAVGLIDFARQAARRLDAPHCRMISCGDRPVRKVFLATGSGMGYLVDALAAGADVMVTGDVRYHGAVEARELGMPVIDPGHYALEIGAVSLLRARLRKAFDDVGRQVRLVECRPDGNPLVTVD